MRITIALIMIAFLSGCNSYSDQEKKSYDEQIAAYLEKEGIQCTKTSSGLYYKIIEQGEGRPILYKDIVSFTYEGKFLDGEIFDERKKPLEYPIQDLIVGWQEIMLNLNEGGKAYLVCPPHLGYGGYELDDIPPNSILVYNLEVIKVK
jgi:FKBP-type peptidyl-prolyl cis-trans isomerase FkpA